MRAETLKHTRIDHQSRGNTKSGEDCENKVGKKTTINRFIPVFLAPKKCRTQSFQCEEKKR